MITLCTTQGCLKKFAPGDIATAGTLCYSYDREGHVASWTRRIEPGTVLLVVAPVDQLVDPALERAGFLSKQWLFECLVGDELVYVWTHQIEAVV